MLLRLYRGRRHEDRGQAENVDGSTLQAYNLGKRSLTTLDIAATHTTTT